MISRDEFRPSAPVLATAAARQARRLACSLLFAVLLASASSAPTLTTTAYAQEEDGSEEDGNGENEEGGDATSEAPSQAPFIEPLNNLATVMGSTLFLRQLCGADNPGEWRERMNTLIESQDPGEADRKRLIASFNQGYRAFESTYRSCTPSAREAARRYRQQGMTLARDIAARFGD